VFCCNHQLAWLYVPSEKQITLRFQENLCSPLAQTFFEGVVELRKHYECHPGYGRSGKDLAVLKLLPKKEDPELRFYTYHRPADLPHLTIEVHNALGNINRISLTSQRAVASLDLKLFQLIFRHPLTL